MKTETRHSLCIAKICCGNSCFGRADANLTIEYYFRGLCWFGFAILFLELCFAQIQCFRQIVDCKIKTNMVSIGRRLLVGSTTHEEYLRNPVFHRFLAVHVAHEHRSIVFPDDWASP